MSRSISAVRIGGPGVRRLEAGHPWVYRTEIRSSSGPLEDGDPTDVLDLQGRRLGRGYFNSRSMITVRLLEHGPNPESTLLEDSGERLVRERLRQALDFRRRIARPDTTGERLVFAEADRLPGVIADRFGDTVVLSILSLGMVRWIPVLSGGIREACSPAGILVRQDDPILAREGLLPEPPHRIGTVPETALYLENGLAFAVPLHTGQKTGSYLDQKENHAFLETWVAGRSVLDACAYHGGFALHAARAGAASVTALDISGEALRHVRDNAAHNRLVGINLAEANVFDYLREARKQGRRFDAIVLDPPAFAKSRRTLPDARRGYKEINLGALRLLPPGGLLATHSCSYHMQEAMFLDTVLEAAMDARRTVRILAVRRQAMDHPVLGGYPESHYLKSVWLEILD